jgi:hypothetical protein
MDDITRDLDWADEDILTYTVSDEEMEAAAGAERYPYTLTQANTGYCPNSKPSWPCC